VFAVGLPAVACVRSQESGLALRGMARVALSERPSAHSLNVRDRGLPPLSQDTPTPTATTASADAAAAGVPLPPGFTGDGGKHDSNSSARRRRSSSSAGGGGGGGNGQRSTSHTSSHQNTTTSNTACSSGSPNNHSETENTAKQQHPRHPRQQHNSSSNSNRKNFPVAYFHGGGFVAANACVLTQSVVPVARGGSRGGFEIYAADYPMGLDGAFPLPILSGLKLLRHMRHRRGVTACHVCVRACAFVLLSCSF
jgi:hypothetical protein